MGNPLQKRPLLCERWLLVDAQNQVMQDSLQSPFFSLEEIESSFLRVASKKRLYTDGEDFFEAVPVWMELPCQRP